MYPRVRVKGHLEHWITPNDHDMFKVKGTNMHARYTLEAKFLSVSFYDELCSSYDPFYGKVRQMAQYNIDMIKVKKYQHEW